MTYQKKAGTLTANSHPGSYCGQDAYNDMFVTEEKYEDISIGNISSDSYRRNNTNVESKRLQRPSNNHHKRERERWIYTFAV